MTARVDQMSLAEARAYAYLLTEGLDCGMYGLAYRKRVESGTRAVVDVLSSNGRTLDTLLTAQDVYAYIENRAFARYLAEGPPATKENAP